MKLGVCSIAAWSTLQCLDDPTAVASVGGRGNFCDNVLAQVFNALYKAELIHHTGHWTGLVGLETVTVDYLQWFNTTRLHSRLSHRNSVEMETE